MPVVVRRERRKKVCARVALDTLLGGRSSAALDAVARHTSLPSVPQFSAAEIALSLADEGRRQEAQLATARQRASFEAFAAQRGLNARSLA